MKIFNHEKIYAKRNHCSTNLSGPLHEHAKILLSELISEYSLDGSNILIDGWEKQYKSFFQQNFKSANSHKSKITFTDIGAKGINLEENLSGSQVKYDLIISVMNMHWRNDIEKYISNINSSLADNAKLFMIFLGDETLIKTRAKIFTLEEKAAIGHENRFSPTISKHSATSILKFAGLKDIIVYSEKIIVRSKNLFTFLQSINNQGEGNSLTTSCFKQMPKSLYSEIRHNEGVWEDEFDYVICTASRKNKPN